MNKFFKWLDQKLFGCDSLLVNCWQESRRCGEKVFQRGMCRECFRIVSSTFPWMYKSPEVKQ